MTTDPVKTVTVEARWTVLAEHTARLVIPDSDDTSAITDAVEAHATSVNGGAVLSVTWTEVAETHQRIGGRRR
jgi:hypothetical protein